MSIIPQQHHPGSNFLLIIVHLVSLLDFVSLKFVHLNEVSISPVATDTGT